MSTQIQRAAGVPPDHFYLRYGATCDQAGLISKATEVFERCLQHYPDDHQVLNYLAYMWAEHGMNLDKAMVYVDRALVYDPRSPAYLDTRGWIHFKNGNYRAALEDITLACSLLPNDATITDHLGDTWRALGNLNKALAYWKDSYRVDSGNSVVAEKLQANGINLGEITPHSSIVSEAQQTPESETPVPASEAPVPQIETPTPD